jgi:hypothetical protein
MSPRLPGSTADVGWGVELVDFNNDGYLDVVLANGSTIEDELTTEVLENPKLLPQESKILLGNADGSFTDVSKGAGGFFHQALVTRGLATADYDRDGKLDVAIVLHSGKLTLLRNTSEESGNWLRVKLTGNKSNRMGVGARIRVDAGEKSYWHENVLSSSYLSSNSTIAHFGLADAEAITRLSVTWPSGQVTEIDAPEVNTLVEIVESP